MRPAEYGPVTLLPCRDVIDGEHVIGILGGLLVHVDHDQRHEHVLRIDLVGREQSFVKVRGRIDVCAPLADVTILVDAKAVFGNRVERLDTLVGCALPVRNAGGERVRQIDEPVGF